jgi:soluble P-type ATPase
MKEGKFNELCDDAGFTTTASGNVLLDVSKEIKNLKQMLIEVIVEQAEELKQNTSNDLTPEVLQVANAFNGGISEVIKIIEAMK